MTLWYHYRSSEGGSETLDTSSSLRAPARVKSKYFKCLNRRYKPAIAVRAGYKPAIAVRAGKSSRPAIAVRAV